MKKSQVIIPGVYAVKISGRIVPVRIEEEHAYGGWVGVNLKTGRAVRIRTAAKLRYQVDGKDLDSLRKLIGKVSRCGIPVPTETVERLREELK